MTATPFTARTLNAFDNLHFTCPHCGKANRTVTVNGATVPCYGTCGCEESKYDGRDLTEPERRISRTGIPERFLNADADTRGWEEQVASGRSLYIWGPQGAGKTTLACSIARKLAASGLTVRFESSRRLMTEIQRTRDGSALERAYACRVLVLDDLGKEQPTQFAVSMLYELVDARYASGRPIVATSNYARDALARRWGEADPETALSIASRLCDGDVFEMEGSDARI